jgi:hypothetical protein
MVSTSLALNAGDDSVAAESGFAAGAAPATVNNAAKTKHALEIRFMGKVRAGE